jgi:hypothetical protein
MGEPCSPRNLARKLNNALKNALNNAEKKP